MLTALPSPTYLQILVVYNVVDSVTVAEGTVPSAYYFCTYLVLPFQYRATRYQLCLGLCFPAAPIMLQHLTVPAVQWLAQSD